jgi:hypothetical protein
MSISKTHGSSKFYPTRNFDDNHIQILNFVIKFENVAGTSISGLHPPKENRPNSKFSILRVKEMETSYVFVQFI